MKKTTSVGGVVLGPDGKILIVNQNNNSWSLPKGHPDPGENEITTAKREIYEESGIKPENLELVKKLGSYQRYKIAWDITKEDKSELKTIIMYLFDTRA